MLRAKQWVGGGLLLTVFLLLTLPMEHLVSAVYVALVPVAALGLLWLPGGGDAGGAAGNAARENEQEAGLAPRERAASKRTVLLCAAGLTVLFFAMLPITQLLGSAAFWPAKLLNRWGSVWGMVRIVLHWGACLPAMVFSVFQWLRTLLTGRLPSLPTHGALPNASAGANERISAEPCAAATWSVWRDPVARRCLLVVALFTAAMMLCVYPAYNLPDVRDVWRYASTQDWNDWHAMGYILFVWAASLGGRFAYLPLVVQGVIWVTTCAYGMGTFRYTARPRAACVLFTVAGCVLGTPYFYTSILYKDTLFSMCLMGFCAALLRVLYAGEDFRARDWAIAGLYAMGVCVMRHGGLPPVLAALAAVGVFGLVRRSKKLLLRMGCFSGTVLALYLLFTKGLVFGLLGAKPIEPYVTFAVPMGMAASVVAKGQPITDSERAAMERVMPIEKWMACYDKYNMDSVSQQWSAIGEDIVKLNNRERQKDLLWLNLRFALRYPGTYITSLLDANSMVWEISRPIDGYEWELTGSLKGSGKTNIMTGFARVAADWGTAAKASPLVTCFVWRGGLWLYALMAFGVLCVLKNQQRVLAALVPPVAVAAMLMLSIPSQDPRYILGVMECALLVGAFVLYAPQAKRSAPQLQK